MSPLLWHSHKLKRVVKSAVFAETMAWIEREEYAMLIKAHIKELVSVDLPLTCVPDNKPLIEASQNKSVIED